MTQSRHFESIARAPPAILFLVLVKNQWPTDSRQKVKFNRLLKLKKSFIRDMLDTAKENVFK